MNVSDLHDNLTQQRRDARLLWPRLLARRVFAGLCACIGVLLAGYAATGTIRVAVKREPSHELMRLFDLDAPANVSSYFSVLQLSMAAGLLWFIGSYARRRSDRHARQWLALAGIFVLVGLDEMAHLRALVEAPFRAAFHSDGVPQDAWMLTYGLLVVLIGWAYWGLLAQLSARTRTLMIVSGALYVGAAAGFQFYGGYVLPRIGGMAAAHGSFAHLALVFLVSGAKLFGIALFIYALLGHVQSTMGRVQINIGPVPDDPPEKQDENATETLQLLDLSRSERR